MLSLRIHQKLHQLIGLCFELCSIHIMGSQFIDDIRRLLHDNDII